MTMGGLPGSPISISKPMKPLRNCPTTQMPRAFSGCSLDLGEGQAAADPPEIQSAVKSATAAAYLSFRASFLRQGHQDLARIYGTTKPAALTGAPHCDTLAKLDADAAKEFDALAAMHASMAKESAH
jgi:hypothetical protein